MSKSDELQQLLSIINQQEIDNIETSNKSYTESDIELLKTRFNDFSKENRFERNQIVKWKNGLKNRLLPFENQPAIVIDILSPPLVSQEEEAGSPYFREPLDILLGFIDEKNQIFILFHYDSRRFEPYETK